jgi:regulatory protein
MIDPSIYDKLTHFCAYTDRCIWDVKSKCRKLELSSDEASVYIALLIEEGFLDEKRFVKLYVLSKSKRKWGPMKIKAALQKKQLPAALIAQFLATFETVDQLASIAVFIEKKWNTIKAKDLFDKKNKLVKHLMSKGYSYTIAQKAMNTFLENQSD